MLRGFDYGLLAALGVAVVHGVAWAVVGLTFGLLVVGLAGGWLIGYAVRQGVVAHHARQLAQRSETEIADEAVYGRPPQRRPRGTPALAALLGLFAWALGSFIAFGIVQITTGQGDLLGRFSPANFAAFMGALLDPPLLQLLVIVAYATVAWFTARASATQQRSVQR